jgi:GDP-L-fucose synthase
MVGSAISRRLQRAGYSIVLPPGRVDLCDQTRTRELLDTLKPDWVFLAAAKVGGIHANSIFPADFIYTNLMIEANVLHAAFLSGVKKVLVLGSSCIYPKQALQPMKEEYFLGGHLEPTNQAYAVAKIAGIVMAQSYNKQLGTNFISAMPCNLYGPNDNFDLDNSHVVPALMRKTHEAKLSGAEFVEIWGTGNPLREFLHVDDLADACLFLMRNYDSSEIVNVGAGYDLSIRDLAILIKDVVGYEGELRFNPNMPDGMTRKLLDVSRIRALGWKPSIPFREGLTATYKWYRENETLLRR